MKIIKYRQTDALKRRLFIIIYFSLLAALAVYICMNNAILAFINSQSVMVVGLLAGIVLLSPIFLITKFTSHDALLELEEEQLKVSEKGNSKVINYADIATMYMNRKKLNQLEVLDNQQNMLYIFWPCNNGDVIEDLVAFLSNKIRFKKEKKTIKSRGGHYYAITYLRQE